VDTPSVPSPHQEEVGEEAPLPQPNDAAVLESTPPPQEPVQAPSALVASGLESQPPQLPNTGMIAVDEGPSDPTQKKKRQISCGACGQLGHYRSNSRCPMNNLSGGVFEPTSELVLAARTTQQLAAVEEALGLNNELRRASSQGPIMESVPITQEVIDVDVANLQPPLSLQQGAMPPLPAKEKEEAQDVNPSQAFPASESSTFRLALREQCPDLEDEVDTNICEFIVSGRNAWAVVTSTETTPKECPVTGRMCRAVGHRVGDRFVWFMVGATVYAKHGRKRSPDLARVVRIVLSTVEGVRARQDVHVLVWFVTGTSMLCDVRVSDITVAPSDLGDGDEAEQSKAEEAWSKYCAASATFHGLEKAVGPQMARRSKRLQEQPDSAVPASGDVTPPRRVAKGRRSAPGSGSSGSKAKQKGKKRAKSPMLVSGVDEDEEIPVNALYKRSFPLPDASTQADASAALMFAQMAIALERERGRSALELERERARAAKAEEELRKRDRETLDADLANFFHLHARLKK